MRRQKMKRSEMVDVLFEMVRDPELYHNLNEVEHESDAHRVFCKYYASLTLQRIEEYGMLPPVIDNPEAKRLSGFAMQYESIPYKVNQWEVEDEEV